MDDSVCDSDDEMMGTEAQQGPLTEGIDELESLDGEFDIDAASVGFACAEARLRRALSDIAVVTANIDTAQIVSNRND